MPPPEMPTYEVQSDEGIPVVLPSGAIHYVLTDGEEKYLRERIQRYLTDNHFVNVSDMQDIDRMIVLELLMHRWSLWLSRGRDYYNDQINVKQTAEMVENYSKECRQLKRALGLDKATRDRTRGDDSMAAHWDNLKRRAREFGYMRNQQAIQAIESIMRIQAMLQFHQNCDETERKENACEVDDVLEVIREELRKFAQIDAEFRHNVQTYWIRKQ